MGLTESVSLWIQTYVHEHANEQLAAPKSTLAWPRGQCFHRVLAHS